MKTRIVPPPIVQDSVQGNTPLGIWNVRKSVSLCIVALLAIVGVMGAQAQPARAATSPIFTPPSNHKPLANLNTSNVVNRYHRDLPAQMNGSSWMAIANNYVYYINGQAFLDQSIHSVLPRTNIQIVEKGIAQFNALPLSIRALYNTTFPFHIVKRSNSKISNIGPNDVWGTYNGDPLNCGSYDGYSVTFSSGWWGFSEYLSHCSAVYLANQFSNWGNTDAILAFIPTGWGTIVLGIMSWADGHVASELTADDMACGYMGVNLTIYVWAWYSVWKTC